MLKRIFAWSVLISVLTAGLVGHLYFAAQHRQARRELIFIKAQQQVEAEYRQRLAEYQKKLKERELKQQYNRGRVVGVNGMVVQPSR